MTLTGTVHPLQLVVMVDGLAHAWGPRSPGVIPSIGFGIFRDIAKRLRR